MLLNTSFKQYGNRLVYYCFNNELVKIQLLGMYSNRKINTLDCRKEVRKCQSAIHCIEYVGID